MTKKGKIILGSTLGALAVGGAVATAIIIGETLKNNKKAKPNNNDETINKTQLNNLYNEIKTLINSNQSKLSIAFSEKQLSNLETIKAEYDSANPVKTQTQFLTSLQEIKVITEETIAQYNSDRSFSESQIQRVQTKKSELSSSSEKERYTGIISELTSKLSQFNITLSKAKSPAEFANLNDEISKLLTSIGIWQNEEDNLASKITEIDNLVKKYPNTLSYGPVQFGQYTYDIAKLINDAKVAYSTKNQNLATEQIKVLNAFITNFTTWYNQSVSYDYSSLKQAIVNLKNTVEPYKNTNKNDIAVSTINQLDALLQQLEANKDNLNDIMTNLGSQYSTISDEWPQLLENRNNLISQVEAYITQISNMLPKYNQGHDKDLYVSVVKHINETVASMTIELNDARTKEQLDALLQKANNEVQNIPNVAGMYPFYQNLIEISKNNVKSLEAQAANNGNT
ncbi:hypothetical protein [Mycoplasmopsis felifaucium]|uniref:Uncharacterized protein n=1 Tax=Mycoplasmopsis felifaucium TaxID=35768 RepID=A0ABZ2RTG0_9BACT